MMNNEEIKNEFINCIEGTHTLNLAISVLEDREEYKKEIERLNNIMNEIRENLDKKIKFCTNEADGTTNDKICRITINYLKHLKNVLEEKI